MTSLQVHLPYNLLDLLSHWHLFLWREQYQIMLWINSLRPALHIFFNSVMNFVIAIFLSVGEEIIPLK